MTGVASTAVLKNRELIVLGRNVSIMDFAILGQPNDYPEIFDTPADRRTVIEDDVRVHPWALIYEGAHLGPSVIVGERSCVGSLTSIGRRSRVLYYSQVHDHVTVGEDSIVAGFVADNSRIGSRCSVFGALIHAYRNSDTRFWDEVDDKGPTLEDDVVVGWGAIVIGPVRVGHRARILPNAVVRRDVEPGERYG